MRRAATKTTKNVDGGSLTSRKLSPQTPRTSRSSFQDGRLQGESERTKKGSGLTKHRLGGHYINGEPTNSSNELTASRDRAGATVESDGDADATTEAGGTTDVPEVQGCGEIDGRGGDDDATNGASGDSKRVTLRTLATSKSCQHPERSENTPCDLPEPPAPPEPPNEATKRQNEPPSVELEEERKKSANCDEHIGKRTLGSGRGSCRRGSRRARRPGDADVSGAPKGNEDPRNRANAAQNGSERAGKRIEQRVEEDSPRRARSELDGPGCEPAISRGVQRVQGGPRSVRNERVDRTDALNRDTGPGGQMGPQEASSRRG